MCVHDRTRWWQYQALVFNYTMMGWTWSGHMDAIDGHSNLLLRDELPRKIIQANNCRGFYEWMILAFTGLEERFLWILRPFPWHTEQIKYHTKKIMLCIHSTWQSIISAEIHDHLMFSRSSTLRECTMMKRVAYGFVLASVQWHQKRVKEKKLHVIIFYSCSNS